MPNGYNIEETCVIAKSSMKSWIVSSLCFEYILAQNKNKNPKGEKFLLGLEEIAKETVNLFDLPNNSEDLQQINEHFVKKIISAIQGGYLES